MIHSSTAFFKTQNPISRFLFGFIGFLFFSAVKVKILYNARTHFVKRFQKLGVDISVHRENPQAQMVDTVPGWLVGI